MSDPTRPSLITDIFNVEIPLVQIYVLGLSILLYEPYANESSQICPFLAVWMQFDSEHHQNRRLSSHSYSHESVIFL